MKSKGFITLLLIIFVLLSAFSKADKKVEKLTKKIWKGKNFVLQPIDLPDSIALNYNVFSIILIDSKVEGYACYTSAYGCRVGGCSAPTNVNAQTYETFDYIVIYDSLLNILKVDIANYGGDYGYEICNPRWLRQFEGRNSGFKLGENVDGITGATVSASHLIDDLNEVGKEVKTLSKY